MRISLFLLGLLMTFSASAASFTCYFWQPGHDVETIKAGEEQNFIYRSLDDGVHQMFLIKGDGWGMAAGYSVISSGQHIASAKSETEVSFRNYFPDFSVSCYRD